MEEAPRLDPEFLSSLEVLDTTERPMPGSWVQKKSVDPRLEGLKPMWFQGQAVGPGEVREIALYTHIATLRHKKSGKVFVAFKESMDALLDRQQDPVKYPSWLMHHPVKKTELQIHIYQVVRRPADRYDRSWIAPLESDIVFDTIAWFLLRKGILTEEMFSRSA